MVKKILVIIIALSLLIVPNTVFADTSSEHTHDFSGNAISFGLDVDGISVQFTETSCIESSCTYVKYDADFLVFHFSYVSDTHLSPDEVSKRHHRRRFIPRRRHHGRLRQIRGRC